MEKGKEDRIKNNTRMIDRNEYFILCFVWCWNDWCNYLFCIAC